MNHYDSLQGSHTWSSNTDSERWSNFQFQEDQRNFYFNPSHPPGSHNAYWALNPNHFVQSHVVVSSPVQDASYWSTSTTSSLPLNSRYSHSGNTLHGNFPESFNPSYSPIVKSDLSVSQSAHIRPSPASYSVEHNQMQINPLPSLVSLR